MNMENDTTFNNELRLFESDSDDHESEKENLDLNKKTKDQNNGIEGTNTHKHLLRNQLLQTTKMIQFVKNVTRKWQK